MPGPNDELFDMPAFEEDGGVYVWDAESHTYVWKPSSGLEQDRGHSTGGDNDLFNQNQLEHSELAGSPETEGYMANSSVHVADYQGWTNWDTWHTKLIMDNERETHDASRQIVQQGLETQQPEATTEQQLADWALTNILGPHNEDAMQSAREWNDIPQEERTDVFYDEFTEKNPHLKDFADAFGGPNVGDTDPMVMHDAQVNWHEIYESIKDDILENWRYENGHEWAGENYPDYWPTQQGGGIAQNPDTGNSGLTLPPSFGSTGRVLAGWLVLAEDWTPDLADSREEDPIWQHTIPFLVFPDGKQLIGRPGQQHAEINGNNWGLQPEYQGRMIAHPTQGETTQWPVDPKTMQEPEWLTDQQKATVQALARKRYRGLNRQVAKISAVTFAHEWIAPGQVACPNCEEATDARVCPTCGKDLTPEWNRANEVNTLPTPSEHSDASEFLSWPDRVPKRNREKTDDSYPSMNLSKTALFGTGEKPGAGGVYWVPANAGWSFANILHSVLYGNGGLGFDTRLEQTDPELFNQLHDAILRITDGNVPFVRDTSKFHDNRAAGIRYIISELKKDPAFGNLFIPNSDLRPQFDQEYANEHTNGVVPRVKSPSAIDPNREYAQLPAQSIFSHVQSGWDDALSSDPMPDFSHFNEELDWKEANTPSLDECPECSDPMFDRDGKKVCTSCGHTQPIIYHRASPVEITATTTVLAYKADPEKKVNCLYISAKQDGQVVGYLVAEPYAAGGFVTDDVIVREDKRRQGIATALVMKGREYGLVPYASTDNQVYRSAAGQALAAKTGGVTPNLRTSKVVTAAPALLAAPEVAGLALDAAGAGAEGGALTGLAADGMDETGSLLSKIPGVGKLMNKALQGGAFQEGQNLMGGGGGGGSYGGGGEQGPDYSTLQGTLGSFHKDAAYTKSSIIGEIVKGIQQAIQKGVGALGDMTEGMTPGGVAKGVGNAIFNPASPLSYVDDAAALAGQGIGTATDQLQQTASVWDFLHEADSKDTFGEDEVGWATNNRGENSDPETASSTGIEGEKEHGDGPEQLKDVDGTGGPTDSAPADDLKNQGDPDLQDKALRTLHMNLPLVIEFASSDEAGAENPILVALDQMMEEAFPGYKDGTDEDHGATDEHPVFDDKSEDESGEKPDTGDSKEKESKVSEDEKEEEQEESVFDKKFRPSGPTVREQTDDIGRGSYKEASVWHYAYDGNPFFEEQRNEDEARHHEEQPGAYVCPNCGYSTNDNEYNCPHCGEELVDHDPVGHEPDQDEYTGPGDYELYGPDSPTWADQFPHEGKTATMGGMPLAPGAVPTGADNGIGALQTQAPVCPQCGQTHAPGTACPYQNQNQPTTAPVMQGAAATPPSPNTVVTKWQVVAYQPLEELGGLPTCPKCGGHGTHPEFINGKVEYSCDQCGQPFEDVQGQPAPQQAPAVPPVQQQVPPPAMASVKTADEHEHVHPETQTDTIHQLEEEDHGDDKSEDDVDADSTEWSDVNGDPLVKGQTYEMNSMGGPDPYAIPDKVTITTIHPHKIIYTLQAGDLPFEDEITKQQADLDGLEFNPVGDADPYDSEDGFQDYEEPIRPGQDATPQVDDLSTPSTVVSHEFEPVSLDNYQGSFKGDPVEARNWLMEDSSPVDIDPVLMEKLAAKDFSAREQREFIDERGEARNLDRLDLRDTHYIVDDDPEMALW